MNVFYIINCNSIIIYTKMYFPVFFILFVDQPVEILPKRNGLATVSESFASNFIISVPLTNK